MIHARCADRVSWLLDRIDQWDSFAEEYEKLHAKRRRRLWDSLPTESEIELIRRVQASLLAFHAEWPKPFAFGRGTGPLGGASGYLNYSDHVVPFRREGPKVGRNATSPYGIGKKLKQCCRWGGLTSGLAFSSTGPTQNIH